MRRSPTRRLWCGFVLLALVGAGVLWGPRTFHFLLHRERLAFTFGARGQHRLLYEWPRWGDGTMRVRISGPEITPCRFGGSPPLVVSIGDDESTYSFWFPGNRGTPDIVSSGPPDAEEARRIEHERSQRYPELRWIDGPSPMAVPAPF